jgi:UDP-N-acetylmuramate dehydrogenase
VPSFLESDGIKVPAAWLVERSGFPKGYRKGNAAVSTKHALALVNRGCTAAELLALADEIRAGVRTTFGVQLEPEPVIVPSS